MKILERFIRILAFLLSVVLLPVSVFTWLFFGRFISNDLIDWAIDGFMED